MGKVRFRKCPECGHKMVVRNSKRGKFWACSQYPDCEKTLQFHGDGARAGLDLEIREIDNGFIIAYSEKFPEDPSDDNLKELYCKDTKQLESSLAKTFAEQVSTLLTKLASLEDFDMEPDPKKAKERADKATKGETDIKKLLEKVRDSKKKAKEETSKS